jgi:hypothetical protein
MIRKLVFLFKECNTCEQKEQVIAHLQERIAADDKLVKGKFVEYINRITWYEYGSIFCFLFFYFTPNCFIYRSAKTC